VELGYKLLDATSNPHLMPDGRTLVLRRGTSTETGERFAWCQRDAAGNWTSRLFERLGSDPSDDHPSLTADGRTMYFTSSRPGGLGGEDLWMTRRVLKSSAALTPVDLLPLVDVKPRRGGGRLDGHAARLERPLPAPR